MPRLINQEALDAIRDLDTQGEASFVVEFYTSFLEPLPNMIVGIDAAINQGGFDQVKSKAHAIKSSCLNAGATSMAKLAEEIEELAQSGNVEQLNIKIKELTTLLEEVSQEVHSLHEFYKENKVPFRN